MVIYSDLVKKKIPGSYIELALAYAIR